MTMEQLIIRNGTQKAVIQPGSIIPWPLLKGDLLEFKCIDMQWAVPMPGIYRYSASVVESQTRHLIERVGI